MSILHNDDLGKRMKEMYEFPETQRKFLPGLPIYARIDGHNFHSFCKKMNKPYDQRMIDSMVNTTKMLVEKTHAIIGYVQSDEISLLYYTPNINSSILFNSKIMKLTSILAGMTSSFFMLEVMKNFEDGMTKIKTAPHFDCRCVQFPNQMEATNMFLWRQLDATKNAISMAARAYFSHNVLQSLSGKQMQEKLFQEKGINFNDYPYQFKRGTFIKKQVVDCELTNDEWKRIPIKNRPERNIKFKRNKIIEYDIKPLTMIENKVDVIFNNKDPIYIKG